MPARSRRLLIRALLAAVLGFTAAFAVACGSSGSGKGLLSADQSRSISNALDAVSSAVHAHSCPRTQTALNALDNSLQNLLSSGTNPKLVRNLGHGASTVSQAALTQCHSHPKQTTTSSSSTTTSTAVVTTTTTTSSTPSVPTTQSVPTTVSSPQTTPATTPSTPASGSGNGGGSGSGGGGGAGLTGQGSQ